jgi:hypothetical protein
MLLLLRDADLTSACRWEMQAGCLYWQWLHVADATCENLSDSVIIQLMISLCCYCRYINKQADLKDVSQYK